MNILAAKRKIRGKTRHTPIHRTGIAQCPFCVYLKKIVKPLMTLFPLFDCNILIATRINKARRTLHSILVVQQFILHHITAAQ